MTTELTTPNSPAFLSKKLRSTVAGHAAHWRIQRDSFCGGGEVFTAVLTGRTSYSEGSLPRGVAAVRRGDKF